MTRPKIDKEGNAFFDLASNNKRRATVSKFKGQIRVDIREFYIDNTAASGSGGNGETRLLPGKKGISLSLQEYESFKMQIAAIDA